MFSKGDGSRVTLSGQNKDPTIGGGAFELRYRGRSGMCLEDYDWRSRNVNCSENPIAKNPETVQFLFGAPVLVRCNQSKWLVGQVRRKSTNGLRVWVGIAQTLVVIPWELISTHLVKLEWDPTSQHSSPVGSSYAGNSLRSLEGNTSSLARFQCVRPAHLSHRQLFQHVHSTATTPSPTQSTPGLFVKDFHRQKTYTHSNPQKFFPRKPSVAQDDESVRKGLDCLPKPYRISSGFHKEEGSPGPTCERRAKDVPSRESTFLNGEDANVLVLLDEENGDEFENRKDEIRAALFAEYLAFLGSASSSADSTQLIVGVVPEKCNAPSGAEAARSDHMSSLASGITEECPLNTEPSPQVQPPRIVSRTRLLPEPSPSLTDNGRSTPQLENTAQGVQYDSVLQWRTLLPNNDQSPTSKELQALSCNTGTRPSLHGSGLRPKRTLHFNTRSLCSARSYATRYPTINSEPNLNWITVIKDGRATSK